LIEALKCAAASAGIDSDEDVVSILKKMRSEDNQ
jgi:hypothetical protein